MMADQSRARHGRRIPGLPVDRLHMNPVVVLRRIDADLADLNPREMEHLFRRINVPQPVVPEMSLEDRGLLKRLRALSRAQPRVLVCACKLGGILDSTFLLLQVNKALEETGIGLLAYRIISMDTNKPSLLERSYFIVSAIAAYPDRKIQVKNTGCKAMNDLRKVIETAFGAARPVKNKDTMTCTSGTELEGCTLVDHKPANMRGYRKTPTTTGFVYSDVKPSYVIYIMLWPGRCGMCQDNVEEHVQINEQVSEDSE